MLPPQSDFVPNFQLYGEILDGGLPDLIHVETLKDRSQHHDWQIRPHRHADLCQFMSFQTDQVGIDLDGHSIPTRVPTILFVPPRVVHGFRFSPQIAGSVTTFPIELMRHGAWATEAPSNPIIVPKGSDHFARLDALLNEIEDEYRRNRYQRRLALQALVELCVTWVLRAQAPRASRSTEVESQSSSDNRLKTFLELVEQNFTNGLSAAEYARSIGTSKSQLARDCRTLTGRSPLQIVHDRLLIEANRKLAYTQWSISQISETLGFSDLGYFSRFYRQRTGQTPSEYRRRFRQRSQSAEL
jgi:AraC family transcriptional activator of pobA